MMKRLLYTLLMCSCLLPVVKAQPRLSARTSLAVAAHKTAARLVAPSPSRLVPVFLKCAPDSVQRLRDMGVRVNCRFDSIVTAQVPIGIVTKLPVRRVALSQRVTLCNDSALLLSHAHAAQQGAGFSRPYTGQGVIVGMIDVGTDFNHVNFLDSLGNSRVASVYMPADTLGHRPVIEGDTLPGAHYTTPDEIKKLTTDSPSESHATHTTGTAAGSYRGNNYQGVAPDSRLVICAMPEEALTDVNIANSMKYIFNYARQAGLPAVINMSLASSDGPHDGTSFLSQVIDQLSGPGRICVVSAGNDGALQTCVRKDLASSADTLSTLLANRYGGHNLNGYLSVWSPGGTAHRVRVVVVNQKTGDLCYASPFYSLLPADSVVTLTDAADAGFGKFFTGTVQIATAREENGKFHSICAFDARYVKWDFVMGLQYVTDQPATLRGWSNAYTQLTNFGLPRFTSGNSLMSISDLATGREAISVGAYCSRQIAPVLDGYNTLVVGSVVNDIATYSSYGPDVNGVARPDIVAPGQCLYSSYNRYDTVMAASGMWVSERVIVGGVEYPYGVNSGTSMSAPVVSGAVALLLQANPSLTPDQVRQALCHSARSDAFVAAGDPNRWGSGKLDISAALRVVERGSLQGDLNGDGVANVTDVTLLINCILDASGDEACDLNGDGVINVTDVTLLINIVLGAP